MLNVAQRIDLMKLSVDLAKAETTVLKNADTPLVNRAAEIFGILKSVLEGESVLDDTDISEVKSVVDVAAHIGDLIE
ncbi:MAG: hypothetical protein AAFV87_02150 [Pseudomonadota bacterium]